MQCDDQLINKGQKYMAFAFILWVRQFFSYKGFVKSPVHWLLDPSPWIILFQHRITVIATLTAPLLPYHTYRHTHTQPPLTSAHSSLTVNCAINRSWCPDRTMAQARKYIAESMGSNYAENVILDLEKTWEESDNRTPLINFLSMGSDPTSLIENLAKRHKFGTYNISLCKMVFY